MTTTFPENDESSGVSEDLADAVETDVSDEGQSDDETADEGSGTDEGSGLTDAPEGDGGEFENPEDREDAPANDF